MAARIRGVKLSGRGRRGRGPREGGGRGEVSGTPREASGCPKKCDFSHTAKYPSRLSINDLPYFLRASSHRITPTVICQGWASFSSHLEPPRSPMSNSNILRKKITDQSAVAGVIGLGYVGLPLAVAMAKAGYRVLGLDVSNEVVAGLNQGRSHIQDTGS